MQIGSKLCTIRGGWATPPKPGEFLDHRRWDGVPFRRGSKQVQICVTVCTLVRPIQVISLSRTVILDGAPLDAASVEQLARADGFQGSADFFEYFRTTDGAPYAGHLIGWGRK